jgi:predicted TIM-barrel fold metal-dependent hydrolase
MQGGEEWVARLPLNFIIPHLGSFADDWRAHERVVEQICRCDNVYADTSGVRRFDYLVRAVRRAGPRKLIYGSDDPWLHPGLELHKIRLLGLSKPDEALILGQNVSRLIGSPSRERQVRPSGTVRLDPLEEATLFQ